MPLYPNRTSGLRESLRRALNAKLVVIGDSIPAGAETSGFSSIDALGYGAYVTINRTQCVSGRQWADVASAISGAGGYASFVDAVRPTIFYFLLGTNDLGNASRSAADTYALAQTEIQKARAAGGYVALRTVLPRSGTNYNWDPSKEPLREGAGSLNALYRTNTAAADFIADALNNAVMGPLAAASDTSLYGDGLHPTMAGQNNLVPTDRTVISALGYKFPRPATPILGTLTLSGTIQNGVTSSGTINGATVGSSIVSNVSGLTVNSGARTYSWDGTGAAATTSNGLVQTLAGAIGSPGSSPITVQAATPTVNYLRLTTRVAALSEAVNSGGGYDYFANTSTSFGANTSGYPPAFLPSGADGWVGSTLSALGDTGPLIGLSTISAPAGFHDCPISIFCDSSGWKAVDGGGSIQGSTVTSAVGDVARVRRSGTSLIVEVSKDGGATYPNNVYTLTGASTAALRPLFQTGTNAANGRIVQPRGSANVS